MALKDIFANEKEFADSVVISLSNGITATLGEFRGLTKAQQKALSDREAAINAKQAELDKNVTDLKAAQIKTAELYAQVEQEKAKLVTQGNTNTNTNVNDPLATLENDVILGPVVKYMRSSNEKLQAELKAKDELINKVIEGNKQLATSYLNDRLTEQYESTVPEAKRSELSIEKLIQHGMAQGYKTKSGYVDIKKSYADLTVNERTEEVKKSGYDEGYKKALEEMAAKGIVVQRPGSGGNGTMGDIMPGANREPSPFKNLDEAFNAAAKDANLWTNFNSNMAVQ
jgi:hypothetical protein